MKGIIALDIDGTLVTNHRPLSGAVISFLAGLHHEGWIICFATGRTIRWSLEHLLRLPFPFYLAPYNGACLYSFPKKQLITSALMSMDDVLKLSGLITEFGAVLYEAGGKERIFFTADAFAQPILDHLKARQERQQEHWTYIKSVEAMPCIRVASVRFFLSPDAAQLMSHTITTTTTLRAPTMKDSFHNELKIVQVTAHQASKGQALHTLRMKYPGMPAIAAGDDMNDVDLLVEADIGIAMASGPDALRAVSTIVAQPTGEDPIIPALQQATQMTITPNCTR
jgi:HAD superfamily hydrolase (TIGR01484 family)